MPCCWSRARPSGCETSRGPTPWSSPWTAPTSGTATTGSWPRCCGRSCAGASPTLEAELHRRASHWHADHGDVDAAIRHAAAAGDVRLAGDLLWANAFRYIPQGHNATVRRWLGHFTDEQVAGYAPLALVAANAHLADGDRDHAEHWTAAAARALDGVPARRRPPAVEAGVAAMRAAIARDGVQRMRDDAARAYALDAEASPTRSMDRLLEGTACHLLGARERAYALLEEGSRRGVVGAPSVNALCLSQLALLALDRDDWALATELADRARAQIERFRLAAYPTMSLVLAVAALTQAQRGRVQAATEDCAEATRLLETMDDFVPWYVAEVRIVLARAALRLSDVAGARALVEAAALAVRATPDAPVLAAWLEDASAQVDAYATSAIMTPATLTTAELRILALLPTHLSFREMGSRLYVSPNTVKTQAQAVYRKLDASSRSEAVARANELGLLEALSVASTTRPVAAEGLVVDGVERRPAVRRLRRASDEVDDHADHRQDQHQDRPQHLAPRRQVVAAEQVDEGQHPDQQQRDGDEDGKQHGVPLCGPT